MSRVYTYQVKGCIPDGDHLYGVVINGWGEQMCKVRIDIKLEKIKLAHVERIKIRI